MRALQSVSDQIQHEEPGIAHVRIDGITAQYSGETRAAQALRAALPDWLAPRAHVASGKFPAYAATPAGGAIIAPNNLRALLSPLSANLLPIFGNLKRGLRLLGLNRLKDIAALTQTR